jgi:protein-S-isoprenylcysteine O-methyltransferase Ste14
MMILRHALSIMLLPFVVVVVIPHWLLTAFTIIDTSWNESMFIVWLPRSFGAIIFMTGFALFCWCVFLFAKIGRGTLAPWDPARRLVAVGPYRFTRNPMISGVALMLMGQALFWGSWPVGLWAGLFIFINHIYFTASEEPGLEKRFGKDYRAYKENVPRWIPRLKL